MRRGSSSGPSELTMNATSMFAARVCANVARPAAFRTSALERGATVRISPSPRPDPVADRDVGVLVQQPPGQAGADEVVLGLHVVRGAMRRGDASRHEAGLQLSASSAFQPSAPKSKSGNAGSPSRHEMGRRCRGHLPKELRRRAG